MSTKLVDSTGVRIADVLGDSAAFVTVMPAVVEATLGIVCVVVEIGAVVVVVEGVGVVAVGVGVLMVVTLFVVVCNIVVVVVANGVVVPPQIAHPVQSPHCEVSISHDAYIVCSIGQLGSEPNIREQV